MASRFFPKKDMDTIKKFNKELVGDMNTGKDGIIYQPVVIYKVSVYDTVVNMYGESASGKVYSPGVQVSCLVSADEQTAQSDEFGPDLQQTGIFSFLRQSLVDVSFVIDIGDIIDWNEGYWEINSINESQFVGGQTTNNHSVICNAFLVRISNLNIERVRNI